MIKLESKIPEGHISEKWTNHKFNMKLVNPANKRKYDILVVGSGLAGASAASTLGELGYKVKEISVSWTFVKTSRLNPISDSIKMTLDILKVRINDIRGLYKE